MDYNGLFNTYIVPPLYWAWDVLYWVAWVGLVCSAILALLMVLAFKDDLCDWACELPGRIQRSIMHRGEKP